MKTLTVAETKNLLGNNEAILIDVREPAEHRAEKIPHSVNMPLSKIKAEDLQEYGGRTIIMHCRTGNRSQNAIRKIQDGVAADLANMDGGIEAWAAEGYETHSSSNKILPLNQQVQITVSLMILIGLLLYCFINPYGLLLPLIAALGLLNAGLTGWCGMAMFLSRMPWNQ